MNINVDTLNCELLMLSEELLLSKQIVIEVENKSILGECKYFILKINIFV